MSKRNLLVSLLAPLAMLSFGALAMGGPGSEAARLDSFEKADGTKYFALSLTPTLPAAQAARQDVVVLFDTSASQVGRYRAKAFKTLQALVDSLDDEDRVSLLAVDVSAEPLSKGFVGAHSAEMKKGLAALSERVPLGSTDLTLALETAAESFSTDASPHRAVVYIGDGMTCARLIDSSDLRALTERLVKARAAVSSFAIGPRLDGSLLAALANHTGGMLAVNDENIDAKQAAAYLCNAVEGVVVWPTAAEWPKSLAEIYPKVMPPLRADRDTVVIGKGSVEGSATVRVTADIAGRSQTFSWTVKPATSSDDFAFLPVLVDTARADGGATLPTIGTAGLVETRRAINAGAEFLAKLGTQAAATGNVENAQRLAAEALRRDPTHPAAVAIARRAQQEKQRAATPVKPAAKGTLKLERTRSEQADPPQDESAAKPEAKPAEKPAEARSTDPDRPGAALEDTVLSNEVITGQIKAEVDNELSLARGRMSSDPDGAKQALKTMHDRVKRAPALSAEVRSQLLGKLLAAIQEATRRGVEKDKIDQERLAAVAARQDRAQAVRALDAKQVMVSQLMDKFSALMDEEKYVIAEEGPGAEVQNLVPHTPLAAGAPLFARNARYYSDAMETRTRRQKGVVDTLQQVELSHIPFPDDEPIVYPPAPVWEELSERRKKYAQVDLSRQGGAEERISKALDDLTTIEATEQPLTDVLEELKKQHNIEIQLDDKALEDASIAKDTAITKQLKGITLRSALRLVLGGVGLTYVIENEVLLITTPDKANAALATKVYPVADLVLPIQQSGFAGGFGGLGGGMGGMGGMMGGGMGGMGGGMGGMGGGMGGFGGGMGGGGGFFNVPDAAVPRRSAQAPAGKNSLKLGAKNADPGKPGVGAGAGALPQRAATPASPAAKSAQPNRKPVAISVQVKDGNADAAWNAYFAKHEDVAPADVRETARVLMKQRRFDEVAGMIRASLRAGQPQPWMYEALALALKAAGRDQREIERALLSGVDFQESTDDLMNVAQYMARLGLEKPALRLFRQASRVEPLRPEPYQYGLKLAQQIGDLEGVRWSALGILSQAWPTRQRDVPESALMAAKAAVAELKAQKREKEAAEFEATIRDAQARDCLVKVTWTGDADVDILIEEPTGTVCSIRNPRTTAGGVILGDSASRSGQSSVEGTSEVYVCPLAFDGTYRMLLRRVWGQVTAGKVTVDIYSKLGTPQEKHLRKQIPLGDADTAVVFDVQGGRRKAPLAEHLVANAAVGQIEVNRAILAQQLNSISDPVAAMNLVNARAGLGAFSGRPFVGGAVGFMPVIITLPEGTNLQVTGVVSADRRYVRITAVPLFSAIGDVTTFSFVGSGNTTTTPGTGTGGTGTNPNPVP